MKLKMNALSFKAFFLLTFFLLFACKDSDEANAKATFLIETEYLNLETDRAATTITIPINTTLSSNEWKVNYKENWFSAFTSNNHITLSVKENIGEKRTATIDVTSPIRSYTINLTQYGKNDVVPDADTQVKPYSGKASEAQPGYGIEKSYDDKFTGDGIESHYHSLWSNTQLPVTLEYYFRGDMEINYFIYYTRYGNGNFGEVDVYTTTDANRAENTYTLQGSYDFKQKSAPSKVSFKKGVKAYGVKFVVKSGLNDFVSCDEMQFFKSNTEKTLENKLLSVFTDVTCSELRNNVTNEMIQALPGECFVRVAEALRNQSYDLWEKDFRIREYQAYSDIDTWAEKLMTKRYSALDNLTGISVEKGDEIIVLVGDTHGYDICLQCIGEEMTGFGESQTYPQTAASGDIFFLKTGVNKLTMQSSGQLFIMYNTDLQTKPQPIKIHIPLGSGKTTGFFDLKQHKTNEKYKELLSKATHKYFGIRGNNIIFYFHRQKLREAVPDEILSAIELWDNIIGWEQELMGIEDVRPAQVNNHLFAISPEGSYMWASDYRIAFVYTYLKNILLKENVMAAKDNAWGPAHEIGHIHQLAIDWPSSSESSNNLFSNFILYKLGKYCSRGRELSALATARFVDKQAWYNMGTATHQGEDTETHMRMNWQLWNYYHRCGYKTDFWQTLFKLMRDNRTDSFNPGEKQMLFARMASQAAQEDLSEFFEMWGFFEPVNNVQMEQYGTYTYNVTQSMIDDTRNFMSKYPKAKPFYYLEDRKAGDEGLDTTPPDVGYYTQFKENAKITQTPIADITGRSVSISNGKEAVAFEIRKGETASGQLVWFSNMLKFEIPNSVSITGTSLYAVQADGERKFICNIQ